MPVLPDAQELRYQALQFAKSFHSDGDGKSTADLSTVLATADRVALFIATPTPPVS
ncbi:MAG TPA: hypothetical protein PLY87_16695 [Planctomycetaceae bacterium]|nr:hypothetical protein [Planctomycetaceae bacterium]